MSKRVANYIGFSSNLEYNNNNGNIGVWNTIDQFYFSSRDQWRATETKILNVPSSISPSGQYNLITKGPLVITNSGLYEISAVGNSPINVNIKLWGSGAHRSNNPVVPAAGGGGFTQGRIAITTATYVIAVGNTGGSVATGGVGGPAWSPDVTTLRSGGYTGIFYGSVSQANSILIAGGGGVPGWNDTGVLGSGGGGGGSSGQDGSVVPGYPTVNGKGGTQIAGGAGGSGGFSSGSSGSALQGGNGGARGTSGAGGGAGGGGYFGGGGGGGQQSINTGGGGGGGGSGYIGGHPLVPVTSGSTSQATSWVSAGAPDPSYPLVGIAGSGATSIINGTGAIVISVVL